MQPIAVWLRLDSPNIFGERRGEEVFKMAIVNVDYSILDIGDYEQI